MPFYARASLSFIVLTVLGVGLSWRTLSAETRVPERPIGPDHAARMAQGLELFKTHVRPLLAERCLRCHGGKAVKSEFDLSDREGLLRGGLSGPAVIVGNARQSLLYQLITHAKEPHMPSGGKKLPDEAIARVAAWIDRGAPYDQPLIAGKKPAPSWTQKVVSDEARQFWSFQPLRHVELPPTPSVPYQASWCRTAVDRFILARLTAAGLAPNPPAEKRKLIRRAYFDLTGLPPAPHEVEAVLNDPAPDAYEKLLDRLLSSERYGERWARHWLDLARFAESHGFEHDYDRPTAYHYRDFVIQAFNADLPYDTFVKWQLAGDEFAPDNNLALMATGFLAAGVHSTQITKNEVEKQRYDEMDDMSSTTGTALLGLTVGCARCHDHKFDPIPQRDYYRILSSFTTTVRSEVELNLDAEGYRKAKAAFDREHEPYAAALKKFEVEQLPARLAAWEKSRAGRNEHFPWQVLDPINFRSEGGATLTKLPDGSLLAGGPNAQFDVYTIVAHTNATGITAVRLEALADPSMVKGGPGRASNGNFALTDFRVTAAPLSLPSPQGGEGKKGSSSQRGEGKASPQGGEGKASGKVEPVVVRLRNARATFEQAGLPVGAAIDDNPTSAWAIDPQFGKDHAASFDTEQPVGFPGGTVLTFTLRFKNNGGHNIGRPRLSVTTEKGSPDLRGGAIPGGILAFLNTPAAKRTSEQMAALVQWYRMIDPEWRELNRRAWEHLQKAPKPPVVKAMVATEGLPAIRLHTQGDDFFRDTYFLRRGDPNEKEGLASPGFLQVLTTGPEKRWQAEPPPGWRTSYRRRALANWITDVDQGAGSLLARVIVNRLWQHHMGRGIVATPSDFGTRGDRPSHPELLDWLAGELVRNGWHLKPIHKLIMASSVYRQSSRFDEAKARADHDNRLCWRRPPHRLEAEVIRDALLSISGELDPRMLGPGTLDEGSKRRSIYFTVKRSKLMPMMQVFDSPEALQGIGERPTTTIAPQALLLMNNPNVRSYARSFARRIAPDAKTPVEEAVKAGYLAALARPPREDELTDSAAFVRQQIESYRASGKGDGREYALADFCQVLMGLNEFVYVD